MSKSISVKRKKAGRPATGTEPLYGVRIADPLMKQIMDWAKAQGATRSEAIRRLIEIGLGSVKVARAQKRSDSPTARDLAAVQIDRLADSGAPAEEQASRKRHLLKGPEEFREARIDRPKRKT